MYLFDDDDAESRTGEQRSQPTKRHKGPINFLDFKMIAPPNSPNPSKKTQGLIATASDDGQIIVYNQSSHRLEGNLTPNLPANERNPEQKICKFLEGTDIIVGADMAGYLNFWSIAHKYKNKLLCRYFNENGEETF